MRQKGFKEIIILAGFLVIAIALFFIIVPNMVKKLSFSKNATNLYKSLDEKIAECSFNTKFCTACQTIPNNSIQYVVDTERRFINLPKDYYPYRDSNIKFNTVKGDATAGWISNAGPYGESENAPEECWSYYYEFTGKGEVDLIVKSALKDIPDYEVRFIVD